MKACLVASDLNTAYGCGVDATWHGLLSGRTALAHSDRIHFPSGTARTPLGLVPSIDPARPVVFQMLEPMLRDMRPQIPADAVLLLATTLGEIEYLEAAALKAPGAPADDESDPGRLLEKIRAFCGLERNGLVVSGACASSTIAVARAAALIESGEAESVLVAACDPVSEFVYAGFATMNALDPDGARPFDRNRQGLNLGEGAGVMLFMSEERAAKEGRISQGSVAGWGVTNDAVHVTRPDLTGAQLARAASRAIAASGIPPEEIPFIAAHGTGTRYNDAMEMAAFRSLFTPRPVFSVKGGVGHTLGVSGAIGLLVTLRALREGIVPPNIGLAQPDECAEGWAAAQSVPVTGRAALITNSGFGGINSALVVAAPDDPYVPARRIHSPAPAPSPNPGIGWITQEAYGRIRRRETCSYAGRTTARLVGSVDALFQHKMESFGRFDPVSRMACYACALALRDADLSYAPDQKQPIGILGAGFTGSLAANRVYFKDYADSGRILARGNLFVYTLPSAPLGEAAIHFGLQGPLFAVIAPHTPFADGLAIAGSIVRNGEAPAMIVTQAEADAALAAIVQPGGEAMLQKLIGIAQRHPQLSQLITELNAQQEEIIP